MLLNGTQTTIIAAKPSIFIDVIKHMSAVN